MKKYICICLTAVLTVIVAFDIYAANAGNCAIDTSTSGANYHGCLNDTADCIATVQTVTYKYYLIPVSTTTTVAGACSTKLHGGSIEHPAVTVTYTTTVPEGTTTSTYSSIPGEFYCVCVY